MSYYGEVGEEYYLQQEGFVCCWMMGEDDFLFGPTPLGWEDFSVLMSLHDHPS